MHMVNATMDWALRIKLQEHERFKTLLAHCKSSFVQALQCSWKGVKAEDAPARLRLFHKLHKRRLGLVFGQAVIDICFAKLATPSEAKTELFSVVAQNDLGKSMFDDTVQSLISAELTAEIKKHIDQLAGVAMTQEIFETQARTILLAAQSKDPKKLAKPRRKVKVPYRGIEVVVKVTSLLQEIHYNLSARIKERGVADNCIDLLMFEADMIQVAPEPLLRSCSQDLYDCPQVARKKMNSALSAYETTSTNTITEVVAARTSSCIANDRFFGIDAAVLSGMSGETGEQILTVKLYGMFPGEPPATMSIADTCANVQELTQCSLATFVSEGLRGQLKSIAEIVLAVKLKAIPQFVAGKQTCVVQHCLDKMQAFVSYAEKGSKHLYGQAALQKRYDNLTKLLQNRELALNDITPEHLNDLRVWWWMQLPEWREDIQLAEQVLQEKHGINVKPGVDAADSGGSSSSKKMKTSGGSSAAGSSKDQPTKKELLKSRVLSAF